MLNKVREFFNKIFAGCHGKDPLNQFLLYTCLAMLVCNLFLNSTLLYWLEMALLFLYFFRFCSRNQAKRSEENQRFVAMRDRLQKYLRLRRNRWHDRKTHVYRVCPGCGRTLRLPKVKGSHNVVCPLCRCSFEVKV